MQSHDLGGCIGVRVQIQACGHVFEVLLFHLVGPIVLHLDGCHALERAGVLTFASHLIVFAEVALPD